MNLQVGASTFSHLYSVDLDRALERLAAAGFRLVELLTMPPHLWPRQLDAAGRARLRARLAELDLQPVSVGPMYFDLNLASTNPAVRDVSVQEVTDNLHLAAELGASRVVTIAGRRNPLFPAPLELTWELGRQSIERCVEIAAGCQVLLCLEPIPYSFLSTGAEVRRMIEAIGSPWLRGLIDTANSHATEGVAAAAAGLGDLLAHVQFSDTFKGEFRHDPVGSCEIDFGAALEAIVGTGYAGPYVLELCCPEDPDGALQLSAERLRPLGFTL